MCAFFKRFVKKLEMNVLKNMSKDTLISNCASSSLTTGVDALSLISFKRNHFMGKRAHRSPRAGFTTSCSTASLGDGQGHSSDSLDSGNSMI